MGALLPALLSLLPLLASAGQLTLQSPRVTITGPDASILRNEPLSLAHPLSPPLTLGTSDTLKLTFQILQKDSGKGVQPHQTFLRFHDPQTDEEGVQPLRVSSTGKANFELNLARPPVSIPPTPNASVPLHVTLIIGSFKHSPLSQPLFDLYLPVSHAAPQHPDEPMYHPLSEIQHTFRPDPQTPYVIFSAIGTMAVVAPWIVLLGLWGSIPHRLPHLSHPLILLFVGLLASFEGLLFWYWVELRLGQVLLYGAILGGVTVAAGKSALAKVGRWRVGTA
ncbi:Dolichyl-diphosphooligosaccharide--protein glycosyltransferase subunit Swp1 [Gautieria morchelliformis]|nr:Dolichyl-diphosphooligosaccharide--protein glycosyltransferase subunit Swp1 [Gautieria morchelliformis]